MHGSVFDQIKSFIERIAPSAVCDDCVSDRLGLTQRQIANHKTRELAGSPAFERHVAECGLCGASKKVIRYKPR